MSSLQYINSKLSDAVTILTIDEGDARTRLAKVLPKINVLTTSSFPVELQKDFDWVKSTIRRGIGSTHPGFPPPYKLNGITNPTASKVIRKIIFIQDKIESLIASGSDS
jgi:hypothetical protein